MKHKPWLVLHASKPGSNNQPMFVVDKLNTNMLLHACPIHMKNSETKPTNIWPYCSWIQNIDILGNKMKLLQELTSILGYCSTKGKGPSQGESEIKVKAGGKAKADVSKAPGVTSSPMKAPKAEAKRKKIPKRPAAALPDPEPKAIAKARAKTVKEMAEGWKKTRDELVSDDHAEGEEEEPKEEEATVADDGRRGSGPEWSKVSRCQTIFSSFLTGSTNSPPSRLFKSQFINKIFQNNTEGEYMFAPGNTQLQVFKKNSEIRTNKSLVTGLSCSNMLWEKIQGHQQALNDAERMWCLSRQKPQPWRRSKAAAWSYMVAKPTSPRMSSGRRVNSCRAGLGALELVVVAMVVVVICDSCGSGSSASSTPAVAASSSTLPKAMCDAPVKLSWASVEKTSKKPKGFRSDSAEIVKDWLPKPLTRKSNKNNDTLKGCPHWAFKDRMHAWGAFIVALMLYNISSNSLFQTTRSSNNIVLCILNSHVELSSQRNNPATSL